MLTYHQAPEEDFDSDAPTYVPVGYAQDGFIHTTGPLGRVSAVANKHCSHDPRPYVLITVDLDRLTVPWRYDVAGEDYPHVYGPLNREAVVAVRSMPRAADGTFLPVDQAG
ncbi:MAG: hypothetical protein HW416_934 [Chloroflexi bacterium]|nr:hypothetical protein [Chloroflexota bacterium]